MKKILSGILLTEKYFYKNVFLSYNDLCSRKTEISSRMTYVDAIFDKKLNQILVIEKNNNKNILRYFKPRYLAYYEDPKGLYKSINRKYYSRIEDDDQLNFELKKKKIKNKNPGKKIYFYEENFNKVFRCLYDNYRNKKTPKLNICFFDIEVNFDPERGYAIVENAEKSTEVEDFDLYYTEEIISITLYFEWEKSLITLVKIPKGKKIEDIDESLRNNENIVLFDNEEDLLRTFLDLIEDVDILSGWNSEKYDIPYLIGRTEKILGKDETKKFCSELLNIFPKKKIIKQFGKKFVTYELFGKIHIDYLNLYRKHNTKQLQSYKLDNIGELELKMNKIVYEGTLYDLYNYDFKKFIEYNRRDVEILYNLEKKLKFIDLANHIAHKNCVLIPTTLGSVALIEQSIINEAHDNNLIVDIEKNRDDIDTNEIEIFINDKMSDEDEMETDPSLSLLIYDLLKKSVEIISEYKKNKIAEEKIFEYVKEKILEKVIDDIVAGAFVIDPKKGLHDFVGGIDITSLYPSTIRSLNMSPETLIGQIIPEYTNNYIKSKIYDKKDKFMNDMVKIKDILFNFDRNENFDLVNGNFFKKMNFMIGELMKKIRTIIIEMEILNNMFGVLEYNMVLNKTNDILNVEFEKPEKIKVTMKAYELYELIFDQSDWCISANGTIFSTEKKGLIPSVLEKWFNERKMMQKKASEFSVLEKNNIINLKDLDLNESDMNWLKEIISSL